VVIRDADGIELGKLPIADPELIEEFGEEYLIKECAEQISRSTLGSSLENNTNTWETMFLESGYPGGGRPEPRIKCFRIDNNAKVLDCTALVYYVPYVFNRKPRPHDAKTGSGTDLWSMITSFFEPDARISKTKHSDVLRMLTSDSILYLPRATVLASASGPQSVWMESFLRSMYTHLILPRMLGITCRDVAEHHRVISTCKSMLLKWYFGSSKRDFDDRQFRYKGKSEVNSAAAVLIDAATKQRSALPTNNIE
jgi:hypothetical protein